LIERNTIFCGIRGWKGWAWPLAVIGTNSIAAFLIAHLWDGFIERALVTHLSAGIFHIVRTGFEPLLKGAAILLILWLFLAWMEQRRIFLRV
jgi:heparan-alpha-glucosaminide N-acetyltransferase